MYPVEERTSADRHRGRLVDLASDMELMALRLAAVDIHLRAVGKRPVVAGERIKDALRN